MQTILFNILLILTVIWLLVGILFLWQQLRIVRQKVEEESKKKNKQDKSRVFLLLRKTRLSRHGKYLLVKVSHIGNAMTKSQKRLRQILKKSLMFPILHQKKNQLIILIPL